jgi:hypothetical protein
MCTPKPLPELSDWLTPFQPAPNTVPIYLFILPMLAFLLDPLIIEDGRYSILSQTVGNELLIDIHIPEDLNPHSLVDLVDIDRSVS